MALPCSLEVVLVPGDLVNFTDKLDKRESWKVQNLCRHQTENLTWLQRERKSRGNREWDKMETSRCCAAQYDLEAEGVNEREQSLLVWQK